METTIKKMLERILEHYEQPYEHYLVLAGICRTAPYVSDDHAGKSRLIDYLERNLPHGTHKYNWPKGEKGPRIEWLKEQIAKL